MTDGNVPKTLKRQRRIPDKSTVGCRPMTADSTMKFILGIESDEWDINRMLNASKTT